MSKGIATYHSQEKDREQWQKAMRERQGLINKIKKYGIKKNIRLEQMSMKALQELLKEKEYQHNAYIERRKKRDEPREG